MPLKPFLRKYFESGESREDPALRVDEIREYWAGIVGESQRSQSEAITAEWAQDCNVSAQEVTDEQLRVWWRMAVSKCKPNKAPGPDGIPGV
uniref:VbhA domain-containing protein n=1 Tax=Bursaphelenchus xylophilus TaxID=6326 RepID=A0A1I7SPU8_BURXY